MRLFIKILFDQQCDSNREVLHIVYVHTTFKKPVLVRSLKLSKVGRG